MTSPLDIQADALLIGLLDQNGGDLRAAFVLLCGRVALADLDGETFEAALGRAVRSLLGLPTVALAGPITGDPSTLLNSEPYKVPE